MRVWPVAQVGLEQVRQPREALAVVENVSSGHGTQESMLGALPSSDVKAAGHGRVDAVMAV
jgi:hypothetical protein